MTFSIGLQIILATALILIIIFQKPVGEDVMSLNCNPSSTYNTTNVIRKITIFLIFCFFTNSIFLGRHNILTQKNKKNLISTLQNSIITKNDNEKKINVPLLN